MHLLAPRIRSEFLATPQTVRFDYVEGYAGFEPTLLVKCSTLLLKYIILGVKLELGFKRVGAQLLYGLNVYDDGETAALLWSVLEHDNEKAALAALDRGEKCQIFLFNELAVNVAWAEAMVATAASLKLLTEGAATGAVDHARFANDARSALDDFHTQKTSTEDFILVGVPVLSTWKSIKSTYITNQATQSLIDVFNKDEGGHQENIGVWLTDNLQPEGAHHGPLIPKGNGTRELTDILLSHRYGSTLIESKSLTVLARNALPSRAKLSHDISGHIEKAVNQLRGGMRRIKDGTVITNKAGKLLAIERAQPMHGIVLIPDFDLIEDRSAYGLPFITEFMTATGGFLHLLDIAELMRVVQAAEMIVAKGKRATPMMAFDYYLMERAKKTAEAGTLCIEVLLRFGLA